MVTARGTSTNNISTSLANQVNNKRHVFYLLTFHTNLTLKMTSAQVVETSVKVTPNGPSQDYTHWMIIIYALIELPY